MPKKAKKQCKWCENMIPNRINIELCKECKTMLKEIINQKAGVVI